MTITLGVRQWIGLLGAQHCYSGGRLVPEITAKGGMSFERVLICDGPLESNL